MHELACIFTDISSAGKTSALFRIFRRTTPVPRTPANATAGPHSTPINWRDELAAARHIYVHRNLPSLASTGAAGGTFRKFLFSCRAALWSTPAQPSPPAPALTAEPSSGAASLKSGEVSPRHSFADPGSVALPSPMARHALEGRGVSLDSVGVSSGIMLPPPPSRHALEAPRQLLPASGSGKQTPPLIASPAPSRTLKTSSAAPSSQDELALGAFPQLESRAMSFDGSSTSWRGFAGRLRRASTSGVSPSRSLEGRNHTNPAEQASPWMLLTRRTLERHQASVDAVRCR
jgi:hypothetical protein